MLSLGAFIYAVVLGGFLMSKNTFADHQNNLDTSYLYPNELDAIHTVPNTVLMAALTLMIITQAISAHGMMVVMVDLVLLVADLVLLAVVVALAMEIGVSLLTK
jgi:hypothetical protein